MLSGQCSIGGFDKDQVVFADIDLVAGLHRAEVPGLVIVPFECSPRPACETTSVALGQWRMTARQGAGMVRLGVVGNDDIDLRRVDYLAGCSR